MTHSMAPKRTTLFPETVAITTLFTGGGNDIILFGPGSGRDTVAELVQPGWFGGAMKKT